MIFILAPSAPKSLYRGERIKQGNAVELRLADSFEIFDFKVSIGRVNPDPSIPIIFEAHVLVDGYRKGKPFMIGEMLLLCFKSSQGYRF